MRGTMDCVKQKFGNKVIVGAEVGVAHGFNAYQILNQLPNLKLLYLIDPYQMYLEYKPLMDTDKKLKVWKSKAKQTLAVFNDRIRWIYKKFEECTTKEIDQPLDFIYIDGNHAYEIVKQDIILSAKLVKEGGVIGGHDFPWGGVRRAVSEYCKRNNIAFSRRGDDWWFIKG